jgi:hypothetical protein
MAAKTDTITEKIHAIIKSHFAPDDFVDVSLSGISDNIHVIVMSRALDDMKEKQKQEYLWDMIDASDLSQEEKLRISMILPLSPDELK